VIKMGKNWLIEDKEEYGLEKEKKAYLGLSKAIELLEEAGKILREGFK